MSAEEHTIRRRVAELLLCRALDCDGDGYGNELIQAAARVELGMPVTCDGAVSEAAARASQEIIGMSLGSLLRGYEAVRKIVECEP